MLLKKNSNVKVKKSNNDIVDAFLAKPLSQAAPALVTISIVKARCNFGFAIKSTCKQLFPKATTNVK